MKHLPLPVFGILVVAVIIILAPGSASAGTVSFSCDKGTFQDLKNRTVCYGGNAQKARPGDTLIIKGEGYVFSKPGSKINYGPVATFTSDDNKSQYERMTMYSLPGQSLTSVDNNGRFTAFVFVPDRLHIGKYTVTFPLKEILCGKKTCQTLSASLSLLVYKDPPSQTQTVQQNKKEGMNSAPPSEQPPNKTQISITPVTYITDNNTAFAPRIQRSKPGSLIPGQPFAVKVEHKSGPPFTPQHTAKMELAGPNNEIWKLGTFEVTSYGEGNYVWQKPTLKEKKTFNINSQKWTTTSQWYIWHSFVPYGLYDELKAQKLSSSLYTLKITAIDETPFITEDNYEAEVQVNIEIPRLFAISEEGLNKGLLIAPKKPLLAEDITINPDQPLHLKGNNFPPGAKVTKVIFGQRGWEDKDSRTNAPINNTVVNEDGTFKATVAIPQNIKSNLIADQQQGKTVMLISVKVEETVENKFLPYEKRDDDELEFKKFENSEGGKHTFDVEGIANIVTLDKKEELPKQDLITTTKPPTPKPPTPKQDKPQPPAGSQRVYTQEELKKWGESDLWRDPKTLYVYIKKEALERHAAEQKKNPCAYPETLSFFEKVKCQSNDGDEKQPEPKQAPKTEPKKESNKTEENQQGVTGEDCKNWLELEAMTMWKSCMKNIYKIDVDEPAKKEAEQPKPTPKPTTPVTPEKPKEGSPDDVTMQIPEERKPSGGLVSGPSTFKYEQDEAEKACSSFSGSWRTDCLVAHGVQQKVTPRTPEPKQAPKTEPKPVEQPKTETKQEKQKEEPKNEELKEDPCEDRKFLRSWWVSCRENKGLSTVETQTEPERKQPTPEPKPAPKSITPATPEKPKEEQKKEEPQKDPCNHWDVGGYQWKQCRVSNDLSTDVPVQSYEAPVQKQEPAITSCPEGQFYSSLLKKCG